MNNNLDAIRAAWDALPITARQAGNPDLDDLAAAIAAYLFCAPDPAAVRLWLATKLPDGRADTLYVKTMRTAHTPRQGDKVYLWDDSPDGTIGGHYSRVSSTYHDAEGRYNITLTEVTVNLSDEYRAYLLNRGNHLTAEAAYTTNNRVPAIEPMLTANGWTEWDGQP